MEMRVFAFACGWITVDLGSLLERETGRLRIPVPVYLIDHPRGRALFDTGLHPSMGTDAAGRMGRMADLFEIDFGIGEDLASRLGSLEVQPEGIDLLVNSHLHFDHAGGNELIPNARLVVQRPEWAAGQDSELRRANAFNPKDYDLGHDLLLVEGEHDLFGDGRAVCIPTYGHTPGHQSLRLRLESGREIVLTADACYLRRTLEEMHLPRILHDADAMRASLRMLRSLRESGIDIFYGHDPEFWETVPQAPLEVT